MSLSKSEVFVQVEAFEAVMLKLECALDYKLDQSDILRTAIEKTGSELAQQLVWDAQKKVLAQNAISDMEDDHVTMGDDV